MEEEKEREIERVPNREEGRDKQEGNKKQRPLRFSGQVI